MKKIYTSIIFVCAALTLNAQDTQDAQGFQEKYFSAWGFSPCLDFAFSPGKVYYPAYRTGNTDTVCFLHQKTSVGLVSIAYEGRYNILQPSDNMAISIKAKPTLSLAISNVGTGAFFLPIGAGLEVGNGSTYQSESNMGFTFTAGYAFNVLPLIKSGDPYDIAEGFTNVEIKGSWGSPFISTGIRYWNKSNKLREINILYSFNSNDEIPAGAEQAGFETDGNVEDSHEFFPAFRICITWMIYFNY